MEKEDKANSKGEKSATWHDQYKDKMTFGQKMADGLARSQAHKVLYFPSSPKQEFV